MLTHPILVVDDEPSIIKAIRRTLLDDPVEIVAAHSGAEGLAILKKESVDLVISDFKMPGMDGIDFLSRAIADNPNMLTILLTAYGDIDTAMRAINDVGVHKFILKPWNDAELRVTVKRALELDQVLKERNLLKRQVRRRDVALAELEKRHPGITRIDYDDEGNRVFKL